MNTRTPADIKAQDLRKIEEAGNELCEAISRYSEVLHKRAYLPTDADIACIQRVITDISAYLTVAQKRIREATEDKQS